MPMRDFGFTVVYRNGEVVLGFPDGNFVPLEESDQEGYWQVDTGKSLLLIRFEQPGDGGSSTMRYSELVTCPRIADSK